MAQQFRAGGHTPIDQLPELSDLERGAAVSGGGYGGMQQQHGAPPSMSQILPPGMARKYKGVIRDSHAIHPDSGMGRYQHSQGVGPRMEQYIQEEAEEGGGRRIDPLHDISCLQIAQHVHECPICSKFYNNDKSVYVVSIVILAIVCLLLLKRVLEV